MPVTHDTEDRDVQHHDGSKVQGRSAPVASWLRHMSAQIVASGLRPDNQEAAFVYRLIADPLAELDEHSAHLCIEKQAR